MSDVRDQAAQALYLRRHELGLSQEEVAYAAGQLSQRTVSELERGKYGPDKLTAGRAAGLARALKWTLYELQEATGSDLGLSKEAMRALAKHEQDTSVLYSENYGIRSADRTLVEVLAFASAGNGSWTEEDVIGAIEIEAGIAEHSGRKTFQVNGDSMMPTLEDGDFIHVDMFDTDLNPEKIYLFQIMSNGISVKRVRWYDDDLMWLVSDNPKYRPFQPDEASCLGRVFAVTPQTRKL